MDLDDASAGRRPAKLMRLRTQIGLALGGLALLTALALAMVLSATAETRILKISAENLENLCTQMARELSKGMDGFSVDVLDQAARDRFGNPATSIPAMREALEQFKKNHPEFAYVSIVDVASKRVVAANGGIFEGGDAAGRPTFEQGQAGVYLGDVHEAVRLAELLPKPVNGEALRFLDVAAPIRDASGKAFRVFAAHVGFEWTKEVHDHVFGPIEAQRGVDAFIVDTQGKVVMSRVPGVPVGTDLQSTAGSANGTAQQLAWSDSKTYLTTVAKVAPHGAFDGFGWKVVARQDYATVLAATRDLRHAFMFGAIGLGLAAAFLAWLIAGRLTQPIRALANAARPGQADALVTMAARARVGEVQEVALALTTLSDSARQRAEDAKTKGQQFAVLAGSLPQVVWQADAAGKLEYVNKDWLQQRLQGTAMQVDNLVHVMEEEDCPKFTEAWRASLATGKALKVRCRMHAPDAAVSQWHDIEAQAVTDSAGHVQRWVGTIVDIHDSVATAERAERLLAEESAAREEAERLSRMRDDFMATVSHELRSPLSAITGWSDILARKGGGDETMAKAAQVIRRNAKLQARLIDDLLDMTAVMAGKLTLKESVFDLSALTREVVLSNLHAAQEKGVALTSDEAMPAMVCGDARRITQVLSNLIGNAIKFTDSGGQVQVSQWTQQGQAGVRIRDTGRGISPHFLPHVFDRLRQEDSSKSRKSGGLGIGLAIAKAVVELHHGAIEAHSAGAGTGAEFSFLLPLSDHEAEPTADSEPGEHAVININGLSILLVDDEKDAREVGQIALVSMGAQVSVAASAQEALRLLAEKQFQLLVSDIGMPVMDGLAFIRQVRAGTSPNARIPAVALSAFALQTEQTEGLAAGFDVYVTKPISLRRLGEGILLAQRRRMQSHASQ